MKQSRSAMLAGVLACLVAIAASPVDNSTGSVNVGTPKKDGTFKLNIKFKTPDSSGSMVNDTLTGIEIDVNGIKQGENDDNQTTDTDKASDLADAINEKAKGPDGEVGGGDDAPIKGTAIGDTVVVEHTGGGSITGLDTTDKSNERDSVQVGGSVVGTGIVVGEFGLGGAPSAARSDPNQPPYVEVSVGPQTFSRTVQIGDTIRVILDDIVNQMNAVGLSASRSGDHITFVDPMLPELGAVASDTNDRTLTTTMSVTAF